MVIKLYRLLLIATLLTATAFGQKKLPKPTTLDEAIAYLDTIFVDSVKTSVKKMTEDEFIVSYHFGLGMSMRNNWGLWRGSRLAKHFKALGIFHPDDMSGIILTSFHRKLLGKDIDLQGQIRESQNYWRANSVPLPKGYPNGIKKLNFTASYGYPASDSLPGVIHLAEVPRKKEYWLYDINWGWKKATIEQVNELNQTGNDRKEWIETFYKQK
ncbi:MAG: DUF6794 domain-containing protein [Chitinophagaceae bacterium]